MEQAIKEYHDHINLIMSQLGELKIGEVSLDVLNKNYTEIRKFNKEIFKLLKLLSNIHDEYTLMLEKERWREGVSD